MNSNSRNSMGRSGAGCRGGMTVRGLLALVCGAPLALACGSAHAATVTLTTADGTKTTMSGPEIPCCDGWSCSSSTTCEDDCRAASVVPRTNLDPTLMRAVVVDAASNVVAQLISPSGVYNFGGLPLGNYTVTLTNLSSGQTIGSFAAAGVTSVSFRLLPGTCYANCDLSTTAPVLNVLDLSCFLNRFAAGDLYANCDASTMPPVLNVLDFSCFVNKFAAGCN